MFNKVKKFKLKISISLSALNDHFQGSRANRMGTTCGSVRLRLHKPNVAIVRPRALTSQSSVIVLHDEPRLLAITFLAPIVHSNSPTAMKNFKLLRGRTPGSPLPGEEKGDGGGEGGGEGVGGQGREEGRERGGGGEEG